MLNILLFGVILTFISLVGMLFVAYFLKKEMTRKLSYAEILALATLITIFIGHVLTGFGTYTSIQDNRTMLVGQSYKYQSWRANSDKSDSTGLEVKIMGRRSDIGAHLSTFTLTIYPRYKDERTGIITDHLTPNSPYLNFDNGNLNYAIKDEIIEIYIDNIEDRLLQKYDGRDAKVTSIERYKLDELVIILEYHGPVRLSGQPFVVKGVFEKLNSDNFVKEIGLSDQ